MKITDKKYLSSGTLPKRALNTRFCPSYTTKDDFVRLFLLRQRTCDNFSIVGKQCLQPALVQLTRLAHTAQQSLLRSFLSLQVLLSAPKNDCNFDTKLQSFFYPLRSNGISSRNLFACISSKRARKSLFFAYHHALACIETP